MTRSRRRRPIWIFRRGPGRLVIRAHPRPVQTLRTALRIARAWRQHGERQVWIAALPDAGLRPQERQLGGF
jgi:hypothetical protein